MFTGLISHSSEVLKATGDHNGKELIVVNPRDERPLAPGDSVAINGVCLTAKTISTTEVSFDVVPETLARSNLGSLKAGDTVNWEQSLRVGDQLGGHLVYGHVDVTSEILSIEPEGQGVRMWCSTPAGLERLIVEKGYVALDGVSLTVAKTAAGRFAIALIPETLKRTTLGRKTAGLSLNVEVDPVARYVAALLGSGRER
ncbi:MAG TPA: riboflavin synthase [Candidatus Acidoferrales bacterium]|nr:riboflavin synthase [Candidatus Acidoferrales bacterium]